MPTFILPPEAAEATTVIQKRAWLNAILAELIFNQDIQWPSPAGMQHFFLLWQQGAACLFEADELEKAALKHVAEWSVACVEKQTPPARGCLITIEKHRITTW